MARDDFFKRELVTELHRVEATMRKEENFEKKIYYFSAAYGITSRTLRYTFHGDYLIADFVLTTCYNLMSDRLKRIKSGDPTVQIESKHFEQIQIGLKELADAFESEESILFPLEKILIATYSTTGAGNYLREKGMLQF